MSQTANGYSSVITAILSVGEHEFKLGEVGPSSCRVRSPRNLPASRGEILLSIDGNETRREVVLFNGMSADCERVEFATIQR